MPDIKDWSEDIENFRQPFREALYHNSVNNLIALPFNLIVDYENLIVIGNELLRLIELKARDFDEESEANLSHVFNKFEGIGYPKVLINRSITNYYSAQEAFHSFPRNGSMNRFLYQEIESRFPGMPWGVFYFFVGNGSVENLKTADYSSYKTLRLELKGKRGGEQIKISIKDETNPTDGSEAKVPLTLTNEWAIYDIPLSRFEGTNLEKLFMPAALVFEEKAVTVSVRNIEYLK